MFVRDPKAVAWEAEPVVTSDRLSGGKGGLWQHTLTLRTAAGSVRGAELRHREDDRVVILDVRPGERPHPRVRL